MEPEYLNFGAQKARDMAIGYWNAVQSMFSACQLAYECGLNPSEFISAGMRAHEYEKYLWDLARVRGEK